MDDAEKWEPVMRRYFEHELATHARSALSPADAMTADNATFPSDTKLEEEERVRVVHDWRRRWPVRGLSGSGFGWNIPLLPPPSLSI